MRAILLFAALGVASMAGECAISALGPRSYTLDCSGSGHLSRAAIISSAVRAGFAGGAKLEAAAKLDLLRQARDSGVSRAAAAGDAGWSSCSSIGGWIAVRASDPKAKAVAGGLALGCTLWGVLHRRVSADSATVQGEAAANAGAVLPDRGIDLPWSGIIVADRTAIGIVVFEVLQ